MESALGFPLLRIGGPSGWGARPVFSLCQCIGAQWVMSLWFWAF
jgi:hypothetical protein